MALKIQLHLNQDNRQQEYHRRVSLSWRLKRSLFLAVFLLSLPQPGVSQESLTGWESFAELTRGNMRFVQGLPAQYKSDYAARIKKMKQNRPHAVVVTCSDSRLVPEILFDQGIGNLHVVRTVGFAQDDVTVASVEYAVSKLGVQMIVFLVSKSCPALLKPDLVGEESIELKDLKKKITIQAVDSMTLTEKLRGAQVRTPLEVILRNVSKQYIERSDILKTKVMENKLLFAEAIFSFQSGHVEFIQVGMPELHDYKLMFRKGKPKGFTSSGSS